MSRPLMRQRRLVDRFNGTKNLTPHVVRQNPQIRPQMAAEHRVENLRRNATHRRNQPTHHPTPGGVETPRGGRGDITRLLTPASLSP